MRLRVGGCAERFREGFLARLLGVVRPDARLVYAADDALFPYGRVPEAELVARVVALIGQLIEAHSPDLVVIACNTASVQVLPALRERYALPFVGTVPAIKPACAASQSKRVSVLGTEATVAREYTHALIRNFGECCDLAARIDDQFLFQVAVRDGGDDSHDTADLRSEVSRHEIDVVSQVFPHTRQAADVRLAAELAFAAHFASDPRDF